MNEFPLDNVSRSPAGSRVFAFLQAGVFHGDLVELVKEKFNCTEAAITDEGDVWIADPQSGHWLNDDDLNEFADWAEKR